MEVGDFVCNVWGNALRFGTITKKTINDGGWAYFQINWYSDSKYEEAINWRKTLWSGAPEKKENYRADEISPIDPAHLQNVLNQLRGDI